MYKCLAAATVWQLTRSDNNSGELVLEVGEAVRDGWIGADFKSGSCDLPPKVGPVEMRVLRLGWSKETMRKSRFTEEQIIGVLKAVESGRKVADGRPGDPDSSKEGTTLEEAGTFHRFQGEFARLHGSCRRGRACSTGRLDSEHDDDEYHLCRLHSA